MIAPMQKRYWLWLLPLLEGCRSLSPSPPIAEDTTIQLLRELYTFRAHLTTQNLPIATSESLLTGYTSSLLRHYAIDTLRWDSLRRFYAKHPELWQQTLEDLLRDLQTTKPQ
ncbi:MAG: DUF4296 domain-containing protein [Bacteroidia bacterium]|nr:DUF4296 domain-containing protein [Bacteroidia bacterium]